MKKQVCFLILLLLCLCLTGCEGRNLEEELLVIVLAVDETETGNCAVAVKVPKNASAEASSSQENGSQGGYLILEATGRSFADAAAMLDVSTPRRLNYSQVREVVIGSEKAKKPGFISLLRQIDGLPRFRCSAALIVCKEKAVDFAKAQKPYVGIRLSRYTEATLSNYAGKGYTPSTTLCDGVRDMGSGFQDPLFILGDVNPFNEEHPIDSGNSLDNTAGNLPRKSGDSVEMFGAAATSGACVSGYLSGYETALLRLLGGHVEALVIQTGENQPMHILPIRRAVLSVDISVRPVQLRISVACEARYLPGKSPDANAVSARLERDIIDVIRHMQALECDGLGFGHLAARRFLTVQAWEALQWKSLYTQAEIEVQVTVRLKES